MKNFETIFDHDVTERELLFMNGWVNYPIQGKIDVYSKEKDQNYHYIKISTLYELRGNITKAKEYLDKCTRKNFETIFDHNITEKEIIAIYGWCKYPTQQRINRFVLDDDQDYHYLQINTLYELRGDMVKAQKYLDKCENQRRAERHGFHAY